jgi:hypothetical protein
LIQHVYGYAQTTMLAVSFLMFGFKNENFYQKFNKNQNFKLNSATLLFSKLYTFNY